MVVELSMHGQQEQQAIFRIILSEEEKQVIIQAIKIVFIHYTTLLLANLKSIHTKKNYSNSRKGLQQMAPNRLLQS